MQKLGPGDPQHIGGYRLLARLGAGGMGQVYLARSDRGRTVAVKLVRAELAAQEEFRARFRQEVQAARRVGGYWTAPVLDADTEAAVPWVATGYVAGPSLQQVVGHEHGALPERSVRVLAAGLAHALKDIHAAGIVHRDLKPSNVLVTLDGPRVIDFGIARALEATAVGGAEALTRAGALVGSPGFMAPEQVRGDRITPACDVFCLGSVLAYAATGTLPFGTADSGVPALMFRIAQEEPDLAGVPEGIADLVRDCLRKDPTARPSLDALLERMGAEDTVSGGRSRDPWLPSVLVAQLGRHAVGLLEVEDPEGTGEGSKAGADGAGAEAGAGGTGAGSGAGGAGAGIGAGAGAGGAGAGAGSASVPPVWAGQSQGAGAGGAGAVAGTGAGAALAAGAGAGAGLPTAPPAWPGQVPSPGAEAGAAGAGVGAPPVPPTRPGQAPLPGAGADGVSAGPGVPSAPPAWPGQVTSPRAGVGAGADGLGAGAGFPAAPLTPPAGPAAGVEGGAVEHAAVVDGAGSGAGYPPVGAAAPVPPPAPGFGPAYGYPQPPQAGHAHYTQPPQAGHAHHTQPTQAGGYGYPQPPQAGHAHHTQPTQAGGYGYPPAVPPPSYAPVPQQPERRSGRSTALLVVVALVVALGAGGSVYALLTRGGKDDHKRAGTVSPAPTASAPAPRPTPPDPTSATPTTSAPADGAVPEAYLGTWSTTIDNAAGTNTRTLTIQQGKVGDAVLTLVADGPAQGGGSYHCVFTARLTEQPGAQGPLEIGPSSVVTGRPASSCTPGEATEVTLLSDGRLKRSQAGGGESLTYGKQ
ncbi:protein kinase [Streptomyces sp. NPDC127190]|uniref:serine/threonine-protein kinase n=1 Tax=unclassified Streptomyces TaxID=2593676 RepID=UPI00362C1183